jgi:pyruvate/2-oxoglutarate dehydrogenase complex dihydrolipoamide dehydrogenase (E3) component
MPSTPERLDAIVIGSGQGGGPLTGQLARAGWRVALIEREHVGGTCVNVGCTPTKTMVASARVAYLARRASDYGVRTGPVTVDQTRVRQRKRDIVTTWREGSRKGLERWDSLELIMGEARFTGPHAVAVSLNGGGERRLEADTIVINTGARPHIPSIPGLDAVSYLDSTSIMELGEVPEHLVIVGGGYIGLEFGQMFRRFGSAVTIIEQAPRCMPREDPDICGAMSEILAQDGIDLLVATTPTRVRSIDDRIAVTVEPSRRRRDIIGTHLLMATGRRPNTDMLELDAAGIEADDRGFVRVNDRLETTGSGTYAIGDVTGGPAFTHVSYDDFRILRANLLDGASRTTTGRTIPYTVFTDPQLGRVGLTEQQAREGGGRVGVAKMPMSSVARAREVDEPRGLMKALVDVDTQRILGAAIFGIEGGEIMSVLQVAMMGKLPYTALRDGMFAHPTLAESLNNLFNTVEPLD